MNRSEIKMTLLPIEETTEGINTNLFNIYSILFCLFLCFCFKKETLLSDNESFYSAEEEIENIQDPSLPPSPVPSPSLSPTENENEDSPPPPSPTLKSPSPLPLQPIQNVTENNNEDDDIIILPSDDESSKVIIYFV